MIIQYPLAACPGDFLILGLASVPSHPLDHYTLEKSSQACFDRIFITRQIDQSIFYMSRALLEKELYLYI